jgi:hypothetical protein
MERGDEEGAQKILDSFVDDGDDFDWGESDFDEEEDEDENAGA